MNVDVLENNIAWWWYPILAGTTTALTMGIWVIFKRDNTVIQSSLLLVILANALIAARGQIGIAVALPLFRCRNLKRPQMAGNSNWKSAETLLGIGSTSDATRRHPVLALWSSPLKHSLTTLISDKCRNGWRARLRSMSRQTSRRKTRVVLIVKIFSADRVSCLRWKDVLLL